MELNYDDHLKPSANIKEARYFNIFECGRNVLDKLDVTYQSAFTSSEKPSTSSSVPPAAAYVSPLKKILYALAASEKPSTLSSVPPPAAYVSPLKKIIYAFAASEKLSTPSSVPPAADYVSPLKKQYWDVQTKNLRKMTVLTVFRML